MDRFEAVETRADNHVAGWMHVDDNAKLWIEITGFGRPIVLLHGWSMSSQFWRRQNQLSTNHRLITIDFRGHGRSPSILRGHTIERYAKDVYQAMDALDLADTMLIGWSMGGSVVMEYWRKYGPKRISALGLIETGPAPMSPAPWNIHRYRGQTITAVHNDLMKMEVDRPAFCTSFVNNMFLAGKAPAHCLRWMLAEALRPSDQSIAKIYEDYVQRDFTGILPSINLPTLAVYGRSRHMCFGPSTGRFVAGSIPNSKFVILDKSGHMPFYEEAEAFNNAVTDFLG